MMEEEIKIITDPCAAWWLPEKGQRHSKAKRRSHLSAGDKFRAAHTSECWDCKHLSGKHSACERCVRGGRAYPTELTVYEK